MRGPLRGPFPLAHLLLRGETIGFYVHVIDRYRMSRGIPSIFG